MYNARSAFSRIITIDGTDYELLCLPCVVRGVSCYSFYIAPTDGSRLFCDMFGLPADQQTMEEAFDIAEANVPDYIKEDEDSERIPICSILLNDSDEDRQTISYDPEDHRLYSDSQEEPLEEGREYKDLDEAVDACDLMYFRTVGWDPEWIEND